MRRGELRAAPRERDPEVRFGVFREGARRGPNEVSRYIDAHRGRFGVEPICRVLGVSASAYYQRATGQRSARAVEDERLLGRIREVHAANYYAYGYRRTWKALLRAGEPVGRDRVRRLMRSQRDPGRQAARQAVAHHDRRPGRPPQPRPRRAQLHRRAARRSSGSRTSPTCAAGRACCSSASSSTSTPAGWSAGSSPATCAPISSSTRCGWRSRAASRAPTSSWSITAMPAVSTRASPSSRSSTITGCSGSIGSVGDAYDNALAESFVDTFKTELIADRVWRTRTQLELAIVECVGWFNHARLHEALDDRPARRVRSTGTLSPRSPGDAGCAGSHPWIIRKPTNPVSVRPSPAQLLAARTRPRRDRVSPPRRASPPPSPGGLPRGSPPTVTARHGDGGGARLRHRRRAESPLCRGTVADRPAMAFDGRSNRTDEAPADGIHVHRSPDPDATTHTASPSPPPPARSSTSPTS